MTDETFADLIRDRHAESRQAAHARIFGPPDPPEHEPEGDDAA